MTTGATATEYASRSYAMVKSLNAFDKLEVKGVIDTQLSKTDQENCFIGTYYRAQGNIESLLEFQQPKHFQAVAMLAPGLFEIAVDIRLLEVIPYGWIKMRAFADVEKLRCARRIVAFKTANPRADIDVTIYNSFIATKEQEIDTKHRTLWPSKNPTKLTAVKHWSGLGASERIELLKAPFEQIYAVEYPRLSWYVHSGLTGVINLQSETFTHICSSAFKLATDSYWEVLQTVIRTFKIAKATEKIELKLRVAKLLPFTDNAEQVEILTKLIR